MIGFIACAALLVLATLAVLLRPLIWRRAAAHPSRQRVNVAVYRDQLARLDQDLADGSLDRAEHTRSREELESRALADVVDADPQTEWHAPRRTLVGLSLVIPAAAAGVYLLIGNIGALSPRNDNPIAGNPQILQMVARLEAKLEQNPSDKKGWVMLGRSYKAMGRMAEAERAYEKAGDFIDGDAQELANYADVAVTNAGGRFAGKPAQLIEKAMRADPSNPMVLWLAGSAARERGDTAGALHLWEQLLALLEPESEDAREVKAMIEALRATTR